MKIDVRPEQPEDMRGIEDVTVAAFLNAPHTDHTEQFIVRALRQANVLSISLVAVDVGNIIGHVAVSPVVISDESPHWYGLGPISVIPSAQGKGVGTQLMNAAIDQLKYIGANGCVILGDPNFYRRFGFYHKPGLILPGVPAEAFQALILHGDLPQGEVSYHESFLAKG